MPPETCLTCRHADMRRALEAYGARARSAYCNAPKVQETEKYTTRPITRACDTGQWQQADKRQIEARKRHLAKE